MAMGNGGRLGGGITQINVTPLVDVTLVLLIVFMITAPMIDKQKSQRKVGVDLPKTTGEEVDVAEEQKLIMVIDENKRVFIGEEMITDCGEKTQKDCMDELEQKLGKNEKLKADREIYLMADRGIPYGIVVDSMARLRQTGVETLGMITDPPEEVAAQASPTDGGKGARKRAK